MNYFLLIIGFALLIKGADFFVSGSSKVAKHFKIPPIIIGLTIVAFGTSSPEAAVSISAAIRGTAGISIGNIIGSNLINISLVIGITALIAPLSVSRNSIVKEIPFSLLGGLILIFLLSDNLVSGFSSNSLSRIDGLILLVFFTLFLIYIIRFALNNQREEKYLLDRYSIKQDEKPDKLSKYIIFLFIGFIGIILGGWLVVENAQLIAIQLGMSETLVGLTIVAIGTSLPEIITSIVAARKKESEIALGNIIGSNIFNIFFVLGISATIRPLAINNEIFFDLILMVIITLVLLIFAVTHKRKITRTEGFMLSLIYFFYLVYIIIRK